MNLAGRAVLVVSLGKLMRLPVSSAIDPLYHHVVILAGNASGVGLLVDRVEDIHQVDESVTLRLPNESSINDCVIGEIDSGGETIHLLDAGRIFLAAEQARLANFREAEQSRLDALQAAS